MSAKRAALAVVALSLGGLVVSIVIAWVHSQIAPGYISFCTVNESINCDAVLSSKYAYLFGIPVAWIAVAAYVGFAAAASVVTSAARASQRRRLAGIILGGATGAAAFSLYLAYVSLGVLHTVCLLCTALYVVNAGLIIAATLLYSAVQREGRRAKERDSQAVRVAIGAAAALLLVLGVAAREAVVVRVEDDPDFKRWYLALPVVDSITGTGHVKGGSDGRVVIAEFSDFECGHCAKAYREFKKVLPRFSRDVRLAFHHYPLDSACNPAMKSAVHRNACLAAMASECAAEQDKFWEYHDLLFDNQNSLSRDAFLRFADELGLDRERFVSCLESDAARRAVESDILEAERLGITSTPTLFINRRTVRGALESDALERTIRLERALATAEN